MYILPENHVLLLKTVNEDMSSHDGFVWPSSGMVESTTWDPNPNECQGGLYGWLWGVGNYSLKRQGKKIKWVVFAAEINSVVEMTGKAKCPKGEVVFVGSYVDAYHFIRKYAPKITEASATGDSGHASATGDSGCAVAIGYSSTGSAGKNGFLILTYYSKSENRRKAIVGYVGIDIEEDVVYGVRDGKFVKEWGV